MGELLDYFKNRFKKDEYDDYEEQKLKNKVKLDISKTCEDNLSDTEDYVTFEVLPKALPYAVTVIEEEPLKSKYVITQIDKTLFHAVLREVDL